MTGKEKSKEVIKEWADKKGILHREYGTPYEEKNNSTPYRSNPNDTPKDKEVIIDTVEDRICINLDDISFKLGHVVGYISDCHLYERELSSQYIYDQLFELMDRCDQTKKEIKENNIH